MVVANHVWIDTRVLKMAHNLAAAGPKVTLVGISPTGEREELPFGGATVVRLPVGPKGRTDGAPRPKPYARILGLIEATRPWPRLLGRLVRGPLWIVIKTARLLRPVIREARATSRLLKTRWADAFFKVRPRGDWRSTLPQLADYEKAFGKELDDLEPDVVHAQDVHLLGVAAGAVERASRKGRRVGLIYDSHEYIQGLGTFSPRVVAAWAALEREYISKADRVITVSPAIADLLVRDYRLQTPPEVVMNIPLPGEHSKASIRDVIGLASEVPLVVYSGGISQSRGVHTLVGAVGRLEGVHLALVVPARYKYVIQLEERARAGGFDDRLHLVPYVEPQEVISFLASATVGVSSFVSGPMNHETTLPNKIFEYMHARLPIVVSDCRAMSEFVEQLGIGEIYVSENVDSLASALTKVLGNLDDYRSVYREHPEILKRYSWRTERRKLFGVYRDLLGEDVVAEDVDSEHLPSLMTGEAVAARESFEERT